ncbi:hydrogenase maturation protease [Desulfallas sp. Bu1-1]|nr:hydrogenase maturation protease [Desulfallas sp. Bu1-1]
MLKCRYVIAVDSMLGGGSPGTIYMVKPEEINRAGAAVPGLRYEIHFLDVLEMAAVHSARSGVTIIGVEPGEISFSLELSPAIEAKLPEITGVVRECLQSMFAGS